MRSAGFWGLMAAALLAGLAFAALTTNEYYFTAAYAILQRAVGAGGPSRDAIVQLLISLRDDKAIPLLCYVLSNTSPGGAMTAAHLARRLQA